MQKLVNVQWNLSWTVAALLHVDACSSARCRLQVTNGGQSVAASWRHVPSAIRHIVHLQFDINSHSSDKGMMVSMLEQHPSSSVCDDMMIPHLGASFGT